MIAGNMYIIRMGSTLYFKIGISADTVHTRIAQLQTGNPIRLLAVLEKKLDDARLGERIVHDKYWLQRGFNEWFYFDPEDNRNPVDIKDVIDYIKNTLSTDINRRLGLVNDFLKCPYCDNTLANQTIFANTIKKGFCTRCNPRNKFYKKDEDLQVDGV